MTVSDRPLTRSRRSRWIIVMLLAVLSAALALAMLLSPSYGVDEDQIFHKSTRPMILLPMPRS